jgi:hypothetical protein
MCFLSERENQQLVFYVLDPTRGKGQELARQEIAFDTDVVESNWDISPDGSRIAIAMPQGPRRTSEFSLRTAMHQEISRSLAGRRFSPSNGLQTAWVGSWPVDQPPRTPCCLLIRMGTLLPCDKLWAVTTRTLFRHPTATTWPSLNTPTQTTFGWSRTSSESDSAILFQPGAGSHDWSPCPIAVSTRPSPAVAFSPRHRPAQLHNF